VRWPPAWESVVQHSLDDKDLSRRALLGSVTRKQLVKRKRRLVCVLVSCRVCDLAIGGIVPYSDQ
jgi:hypothetical protein